MKTYRITFSHGMYFDFQAASMEDDGRKLRLLGENGDLVISYQDSEIESCVELAE